MEDWKQIAAELDQIAQVTTILLDGCLFNLLSCGGSKKVIIVQGTLLGQLCF